MTQKTDYISPEHCDSLAQLLLLRARKHPEKAAYKYFNKVQSRWQEISWQEMVLTIARWRAAFIREGLGLGDRVAIMLGNGPDWIAYEQAALSLGLVVVPLYANDRPDNIAYILKDTKARILLCPGGSYWQSLNAHLDELDFLQRVVTTDECQPEPNNRIICLSDWLMAADDHDAAYTPVTNDLATIVYTSGTTGPPKGVMLSHKNILHNSYAGLKCMDVYANDLFLSFLPLSHMLERTAGYYMPMMCGATVAFARSIPQLAEDLTIIKPTLLVAVPRIFEKIHSALLASLKKRSPFMRSMFQTAVESGWQTFLHSQGRMPWNSSQLLYPVLNKLVAEKVRARFGGKLRIIISGGAALNADIAKVFIGLGLPIYQGYGLTESSPVISVNRQEDNRPDGVGKPLPGLEVRTEENGELVVRGHSVMLGYWQNEPATRNSIDEYGWLHTGDKAVIEDGHIRITGRLKEIIVLSNGEKVSLTDMEMAISMDPLFDHCLVTGEGRPYLTMLAVLNQGLFEELAGQQGFPTDESALALPEVRRLVMKRVEEQLTGFPGFVFIKDIALSLKPWTVEDGLLTPTLKLKRGAIERHMADELHRMYNDNQAEAA